MRGWTAMTKPTLVLALRGKNLSLPLSRLLWVLWRLATYPLTLLAAYYFLGTEGVLFTALLLVLTNRGQL